MAGIGVINNPRSRQNVRNPERIPKLGYILGGRGESKETRTFEELEDCLREFKRLSIDILAINGGDGSTHVTLTKLIEVYGEQPLPMIALLRGGTLNTISASFGIKGQPDYILYNIAAKYAEGAPFKTHETNLINANGKYSFLYGNGFVANFMQTYYATGRPSPSHGVAVMLRGVASIFTGAGLARRWFEPVQAVVTIDGETLPDRAFTAMLAATVENIGVGFRPWCRAFWEPDKFHAICFTSSPLSFAPDIPLVWFARPIHPRNAHEMLAKEMTIEAEKPFYYTQDGDMYTCEDGKMKIAIGPRVTIIVE
ncbi:MAG: hypothetical protein C4523_06040 [Myxococcales bacterium]|nr:MAG: hypothetical protein C4523_06040 [Myxococcales bacterium]